LRAVSGARFIKYTRQRVDNARECAAEHKCDAAADAGMSSETSHVVDNSTGDQ